MTTGDSACTSRQPTAPLLSIVEGRSQLRAQSRRLVGARDAERHRVSNYLVIVHAPQHDAAIDRWLRRWSTPSETHVEQLGRSRLVIVSKDVERSIQDRRFFRGSAVATEHGAIVFGIDGWTAAPAGLRDDPGSASGEFVALDWSDGSLRLDRDVFGSVRTAHTRLRGLIAASDSLLVLASLRSALGARNRLHVEVATARTARSAVAAQQLSPDTLVQGIDYLPAGRGLRQRRASLRWALTGERVAERVEAARSAGTVELLRRSADDTARVLGALPGVPGWHTRLSLSGGQDSRAVLAAATAMGVGDAISIHTAPRTAATAADHDVAMHLAQARSLRTEAPSQVERPVAPDEAQTLWAASLLGLYDDFGPLAPHRQLRSTFALTGVGAELHKGNWDWQPLDRLADGAAEGVVRDAVHAQLRTGARSVGADPRAGSASELVYLGYRNGIHGSAGHISLHMTTISPLMQLSLSAAGHQPGSAGTGFAGSRTGISAMIAMLDPGLVTEPYAEAEHAVAPEVADRLLAAVGGPLEPGPALTVHGRPDDIPRGPSALSMRIADDWGFRGPLAVDAVMAGADDAVAGIRDRALRGLYVDLLANARWRLDRSGGNLRAEGRQPARIRSLALIAGLDD